MKTFRTVLLWLFALALLAALSWGLTLYLEWPLWASLAIFFGLLGAYFVVKVLRRLLLGWRSRSIIARQDLSARQAARRASPSATLTQQWRTAVATLRGSSLKRLGNPLYALPWYMVVGRSGSGKTTALTRARLASPIQRRARQSAAITQTESCDWWYFDKSVVIDCAGRYVGAENLEADRREWEVGLDLLSRYRSREGLNGLVLAISADRLSTPDKDELDEEARVVRERIEQLIRLFGKRFPVYLLVTKCDRLYGFENWSRLLPEAALDQAMGYLAEDSSEEQHDSAFLDAAFASVAARLRGLRLALVAQHPEAAAELLLFPSELEQIQAGLQTFAHGCLGSNPYLESPFLRGLFFSSALQEGGARSSVLGSQLPPTAAHPPSSTGVFLHDLFGRVLPQDRHAARPAALINRWRAATQNLGLLAWLLIALAIAILMTMSFIRNINTVNLIRSSYPFSEVFTGRIADDAATLGRASDALQAVDRRNHDWRSRWMINTEIAQLEARMRQRYTSDFSKFILPATRLDFDSDINQLLVSDPHGRLPGYILNEVRTINLLHAKVAGASRPQLAAMPQMVYNDTDHYSPALFDRINDLRVSYLAWIPANALTLANRLSTDQRVLSTAIYSAPPLGWMIGLAPLDPHLKPVTLADFWLSGGAGAEIDNAAPVEAGKQASGHIMAEGSGAPSPANAAALPRAAAVQAQASQAARAQQAQLAAIEVPIAYTRAGRRDLDGYIAETQQAAHNGSRFLANKAQFERDYLVQRLQAWQTFISRFPEGEQLLSGEPAWRTTLGTITGSDSPYLRALKALNQEFSDLPDDQLPSWLKLARRIGKLRAQASGTQLAGRAGQVVSTINSFGGQALKQTLASGAVEGSQTLRSNLNAAGALRQYFTDIDRLGSAVITGPGKAYEVAAEFHAYGIDPAVKTSPVHDAAHALASFRSAFGTPAPADQAVWQLVGGPLHFALAYTEMQTSCALQSNWEAKVYWPLQSATSMTQVVDQLYGPQGSVWAFADGIAKPFLQHGASGFSSLQTAGYSVPFTDAFLPTLNAAVGKRVAQLVQLQRQKARTEQEQAQAQAAQEQAKQQQANAEQALADIKQKIATLHAQAYPLTLTAQPSNVNPGARARPFATVLSVQCAAGGRTLTNYNFPVSDSFNWALGQCGTVTLTIRVNDLALTKRYPGDAGVVHFLQDFRDGQHVFMPADFPAARATLEALAIQQISVHYDLQGQTAILAGAQQLAQLLEQQTKQTQLLHQAIDAQANQTQQLLLIKMASANGEPERPLQVSLPQRIGMCWNENGVAHGTQTLQQMFDGLMDNRGALLTASPPLAQNPMPSYLPSTAPELPPLPTLAPLGSPSEPATRGG